MFNYQTVLFCTRGDIIALGFALEEINGLCIKKSPPREIFAPNIPSQSYMENIYILFRLKFCYLQLSVAFGDVQMVTLGLAMNFKVAKTVLVKADHETEEIKTTVTQVNPT